MSVLFFFEILYVKKSKDPQRNDRTIHVDKHFFESLRHIRKVACVKRKVVGGRTKGTFHRAMNSFIPSYSCKFSFVFHRDLAVAALYEYFHSFVPISLRTKHRNLFSRFVSYLFASLLFTRCVLHLEEGIPIKITRTCSNRIETRIRYYLEFCFKFKTSLCRRDFVHVVAKLNVF